MQKFVSAMFIASLLLPAGAFANCEAGGYMIHTVAKYADADSLEAAVMIYSVEKNQVKATKGAIVNGGPAVFKETPEPITIQLGKEECKLKNGWSTETSTLSDEETYILDLSACKGLAAKFLSKGYLFFNNVLKTVRFGKKLDVKEAKAEIHAELKKAAALDARKRKLERPGRIVEGVNTERANVEIKAGEIKGEEDKVIELGKDFRMLTHTLLLSPLPPLPKGQKEVQEGPATSPLSADSKKLVTYPVLYFAPPKAKEPTYIGDGSYCSSNIGIKGDAHDQGKFAVTNAFDFDLDGNPDLLEVNDRFTYWIDDKGEPLVINYGQGC
jgi:hypothetical protein